MLAMQPLDIPIEEKIIYLARLNAAQVSEEERSTLSFNGRKYHRYMDCFYTYNELSEMDKDEVELLSSLRIEKDSEVIDYDYTKAVISYLLSISVEASNESTIIDFGCGNGILAEVLKEGKFNVKSLIGLDLASFALKTAEKAYNKNLPDSVTKTRFFYKNNKLEELDNTVDTIISSFVMHFPVFESQLREFFRVLKPNGKFVYNDYIHHKQPAHYKKILQMLKVIGFTCKETTFSLKSSYSNKVGSHRIVECLKPE
ncbi:class I SAM-dependent methyltransferase [Pseudoalteromonas sp. XMcav1-K]|uniref:class I SAM-dependent methyltransferase n=1 Tax=Pseudoalteromonas sp. XMcav1-K TaxID=3374372 RepID=UPI00375826EE